MKSISKLVIPIIIACAETASAITVTPVRVSPVRVTPVRTTPAYRSAPGVAMMPMYAAIIIASSRGNTQEVSVATPLLTMCGREEFRKAKEWQKDCSHVAEVSNTYCPLLSYFRYCKEATPDQVKGLVPASEKYRHVFITEE